MSWLIPAWEDGVLRPLDKLDVHRRGLKHKAISVFVTEGDRVLLQRRADHKYHTPGLWTNTCCTHPHWGESDLDCANRRLQEEMGITGLHLRHVAELNTAPMWGATWSSMNWCRSTPRGRCAT